MPARPEESAHVTAIYGDWVALNCDVNFPDGHVVPYVVHNSGAQYSEELIS